MRMLAGRQKIWSFFKGINIATNKNDVLHRLFSDDVYQKKETSASLAPSMDISVASNFERLLFEIYKKWCQAYDTFSSFPVKSIDFNQSDEIWQEVKAFFKALLVMTKKFMKQL